MVQPVQQAEAPADRETEHGNLAEQRQVTTGFLEDPAPGSPERRQDHGRHDQAQHALEQHQERPEHQPRQHRRGIALDAGDHGDLGEEALLIQAQ